MGDSSSRTGRDLPAFAAIPASQASADGSDGSARPQNSNVTLNKTLLILLQAEAKEVTKSGKARKGSWGGGKQSS